MKSIAALALVLPLTLAACGNDEEDNAATGSTTAKTTASSKEAPSESAAPSSEAPSSEKPKEESAAPEKDKKPAEGDNAEDVNAEAAPSTLVNSFEDGAAAEATTFAPGDGDAGDDATKETITNLINGTYKQQDVRSLAQYTRDNTCARVVNENQQVGPNGEQLSLANLDLSQFDNLPADQKAILEPYNQQIRDNFSKTTTDIQDVRVNGNTASATVTVNSPAGSETNTMVFENEGGAWKFCNPAS